MIACWLIDVASDWSMILNCSMRMFESSIPYFSMKSSCSLLRNASCAWSKKSGAVGSPAAFAASTFSTCLASDTAVGDDDCAISESGVERRRW